MTRKYDVSVFIIQKLPSKKFLTSYIMYLELVLKLYTSFYSLTSGCQPAILNQQNNEIQCCPVEKLSSLRIHKEIIIIFPPVSKVNKQFIKANEMTCNVTDRSLVFILFYQTFNDIKIKTMIHLIFSDMFILLSIFVKYKVLC